MLGPSPRAIALKRVPGIKEFGPSARFIPWPYGKPGATLSYIVRLKIAQKPYTICSLGPKALKYESLEPQG